MVKDKPMTVIEHLEELRKRLIVCIVSLLVATGGAFFYAGRLLEFIRKPAGELNLVILAVGEGFFVHLKIAVVLGFFIALPVMLYQMIRFVLPALERHERRYLFIMLPASLVLFALGMSFAYVSLLPWVIRFFLSFGSATLEPVISVSAYVSFVIGLLVPFGIVFQLPVVVVLLTKLGIITPAFLRRQRKWAILLVFVLAAVLTPPDIVSQIFLAIPMIALYELSILLSSISRPREPEEPS